MILAAQKVGAKESMEIAKKTGLQVLKNVPFPYFIKYLVPSVKNSGEMAQKEQKENNNVGQIL